MMIEGAEDLPDEQLQSMAELTIKEAKSGSSALFKSAFVLLTKSMGAGQPEDPNPEAEDCVTFQEFMYALRRMNVEQKCSVKFSHW